MGRNNQQRRAAKRRARAANGVRSPDRAPGFVAGPDPAAAAAEFAQVGAADEARALVITGARLVGRPDALDDAVRDLVVFSAAAGRGPTLASREATALLFTELDTAYAHGWQPADLLHVARRERTTGVARLAAAVVLAHGLAQQAPSRAGQPWVDQLEAAAGGPLVAVAADPAWNVLQQLGSRVAVWDAWHDILTLVAHWMSVVPLPTLMPPPSAWGTRRGSTPTGPRPGPGSGHDRKKLGTIRALLAKAEATEFAEEADTFTAKAQDLMTRYAIDEALLTDDSEGIEISSRRVHVDDPYAGTKAHLLATVGTVNHVRTIWDDQHGIATVVGMPVDLDLAEMLFTSLLVQATKAMTEAGSITNGGHRLDRRPSFRRAFLLAYADRIGQRLRQAGSQAQQQESTTRGRDLLPVLARQSAAVQAEFQRLFPHATSSGAKRVDARGWQAGQAAADRAVLARGRIDGG